MTSTPQHSHALVPVRGRAGTSVMEEPPGVLWYVPRGPSPRYGGTLMNMVLRCRITVPSGDGSPVLCKNMNRLKLSTSFQPIERSGQFKPWALGVGRSHLGTPRPSVTQSMTLCCFSLSHTLALPHSIGSRTQEHNLGEASLRPCPFSSEGKIAACDSCPIEVFLAFQHQTSGLIHQASALSSVWSGPTLGVGGEVLA